MSNHTPGPWEPEMAGEYIMIFGPKPAPVVAWIGDDLNSQDYANARLIAAAPTMYEYIRRRADANDTDAQTILEAIHANS